MLGLQSLKNETSSKYGNLKVRPFLNILAKKMPDIEDRVNMVTVIIKKALHEFLLVKCKEGTNG